jgi:peptide/nickel transport system substrate-binding protein
MFSRKRLAALAAAAAMALALTACTSDSDGSGSGRAGGTSESLTLGAVLPPTSFAANATNWGNESIFVQAVYDSLLRETPDAEIEPWLATEWSYDDTKTVLTMTLRDDVTFTDGTKFDADVAAQNLLRFKTGTSPQASAMALVSEVTAEDPTTLRITLSQPDPALLLSLAQNPGAMASPASFDAEDAQTNPVGSGPYVLDTEQTVVGSTYVFERNQDYWAPEDQHYQTLTINVLDNAQTQVNAIQGGQVDLLNLVDASSMEQVEAAGFVAYPSENNWQGLFLFDRQGQLNPALGDVRVRQAIAHAIDRDAMLEAVAGGRGTVTGQIFNPDNPAYDESLDDQYPYDPDRAKELLDEAGYADGFTLQMPLVQLGTTAVYDLTQQYLEEVGITVEFVNTPVADIIGELVGAKYAAAFFILQQLPTAWQDANLTIAQTAPFNVFHGQDSTVDGLLQTIQTGSQADSDKAAQELNQYVVDQAWFVPFFRAQGNIVASAQTEVELQVDAPFPSLWNISPKS